MKSNEKTKDPGYAEGSIKEKEDQKQMTRLFPPSYIHIPKDDNEPQHNFQVDSEKHLPRRSVLETAVRLLLCF
jgi:hypothetical protein